MCVAFFFCIQIVMSVMDYSYLHWKFCNTVWTIVLKRVFNQREGNLNIWNSIYLRINNQLRVALIYDWLHYQFFLQLVKVNCCDNNLRSSDKAFRSMLAGVLHDINYCPSFADLDIWVKSFYYDLGVFWLVLFI